MNSLETLIEFNRKRLVFYDEEIARIEKKPEGKHFTYEDHDRWLKDFEFERSCVRDTISYLETLKKGRPMFKYFRHKYYTYLNNKWAARMKSIFMKVDCGISVNPTIDTISEAIDSIRIAGFTPVIITNYGWYVTNPDFINWFDPNTKYSEMCKGKSGVLFAVPVINDAIFPINKRFLKNKTECIVCGIDKRTYDKYF